MKKIYFYVAYPYYFPHFLPIGNYFTQKGHDVIYILSEKQNSDNMQSIAEKNRVQYRFGTTHLYANNVDVVFFANRYENMAKIKALKVILEHGVGTKNLTNFYDAIQDVDIYLTEGQFQYQKMSQKYPEYVEKLAMVGFSKLDSVFQYQQKKEDILNALHLDPRKKTILYAPTFFPASIEKMKDNFPAAFSECNIVVKPHYLSYERKKYRGQRKKFEIWSQYDNCAVVPLTEYDLVPFMAIADVMISDESSAMFEFAALNKPVVSNQYFKLRWSYYLMPWKLKKRIDQSKAQYRVIFDEAFSYKETLTYTQEALENPDKKAKERLAFAKEICGTIDGKVSERIYQVVKERLSQL